MSVRAQQCYSYSAAPETVRARIDARLAVRDRNVIGITSADRFEIRVRRSPLAPARPLRLTGRLDRTVFGCSVCVIAEIDRFATLMLSSQLVFAAALVVLGVLASFRQPIWLLFALFPLAVIVMSWLPVLVRMQSDERVLHSWLLDALRGLPASPGTGAQAGTFR